MTIDELLADAGRRRFTAVPEIDALADVDALQEAQLLDVRLDTLRSRAALLFDCRGALAISMGNTALVVVDGVRQFAWTGSPHGPRTAWSVVGWVPRVEADAWTVRAAFWPTAQLEVAGRSSEFFVGDVPGCDDAPPDYTAADEATLRAGIAGWGSEFEPMHAVFLDGSPRL